MAVHMKDDNYKDNNKYIILKIVLIHEDGVQPKL